MRRFNAPLILATAIAVLHLPAPALAAGPAEASATIRPARIESIAGSNLRRLVLSERAARRLDIQTGEVRQDSSGETVIPYSSVLYDLAGVAWAYTNPSPLTFIRHRLAVARISGANVYLTDGPPVGTHVVTIGVSELYGAEKGIGH